MLSRTSIIASGVARPRLDDLEERRIPQLDAVGLQSHLDDRLSDVVADGRVGGAGE